MFTYVWDSLPEFVQWVGCVAEAKFPCFCDVNEEGAMMRFEALPLTTSDAFELKIGWFPDSLERPIPPADQLDYRLLLQRTVSRQQFLNEFLTKFEHWRANKYVPEEWQFFFTGDCSEGELALCAKFDPRIFDLITVRNAVEL